MPTTRPAFAPEPEGTIPVTKDMRMTANTTASVRTAAKTQTITDVDVGRLRGRLLTRRLAVSLPSGLGGVVRMNGGGDSDSRGCQHEVDRLVDDQKRGDQQKASFREASHHVHSLVPERMAFVGWLLRDAFAVDTEDEGRCVVEVVEPIGEQCRAAGDQAHDDLANRQTGIQNQRPDEPNQQRRASIFAGMIIHVRVPQKREGSIVSQVVPASHVIRRLVPAWVARGQLSRRRAWRTSPLVMVHR